MKMGSADSDLFGEGSLVEVSSEADGFPGMWYVAKVLERPPSTLSPPSSTKKEMILVEYQQLHSNGGTKLIKPVNFKFVRPLPPDVSDNEHQTLEVNDLVDGYLVDAWWVGVVYEVLKEEPRGYSVLLSNPPDLINFKHSDVRLHLDWVDHKWVRLQKQIMQQKEVVTSNQKREEDKKCGGAEGTVVGEECATIGVELAIIEEPTETATELSDSGSKAKDIEMAIPCNTVDVDEPTCLPTILVDSNKCGRTINQSSELKQRSNEVVVHHDEGAAIIDNMESSPVLRFIQSMEVFQSMPQEPHFRPLAECEEVCREGLALGHMMTFVNVVKRASKLQVNAPRSNFDSLFKCLAELELQGFDVKAVRNRLLELQSMKESQEQLKTKSKKIKSEILEQIHERTKVEAKLDDVVKDLKVLEEKKKAVEEKKTRLISMNNENDSEIAKAKSSVNLLNEEIQKVKHKFRSLAASPWK
ncbi:hypothetical protein ACOSP7_014181 [Xanthoceras sorbifolium]